jgi:rhamnosyltransferase
VKPSSTDLRITAVTTAYHPDERLRAVVEAALGSCEKVIVADNTPAASSSLARDLGGDRVEVLSLGANLGVAAALNAGLRAVPPSCEAVLLLDQDSVLSEELVIALAAHLAQPGVVAAAPSPWDAASGTHYGTLTSLQAEVTDQDAVITSGMLVRRAAADAIGGFREDLFVDYVDIDFCLRLRTAGGRIVQDKSLRLPHSIGDRRTHRVLGIPVKVIHYPAWRHYWIARNGVILIAAHGRRFPAWSLRTALYLLRWVAVTAAFEPSRRQCLRAFLRGLRDAAGRRLDPAYRPGGAATAARSSAA